MTGITSHDETTTPGDLYAIIDHEFHDPGAAMRRDTSSISRRAALTGGAAALLLSTGVQAQRSPGVYVEEIPSGHRIEPVATDRVVFIVSARAGTAGRMVSVRRAGELERILGRGFASSVPGRSLRSFFAHGGREALVIAEPARRELASLRKGLHALKQSDEAFNVLCLPEAALLQGARPGRVRRLYRDAAALCRQSKAMLLMDVPQTAQADPSTWRTGLGLDDPNAALYYPLLEDTSGPGAGQTFPASAAVAGLLVRTDRRQGVWKAPAGLEARITGAQPGLDLTQAEAGSLDQQGINPILTLSGRGTLVWGARTLASGGDYKYVPVRRLSLFIEESLQRGLRWAVFEPNDEPLWRRVRASVNTFLADLFRQGAFQGTSARDAFYVRCGRDTMTAADISAGRLNLIVGFAPVRPAEFIPLTFTFRMSEAP